MRFLFFILMSLFLGACASGPKADRAPSSFPCPLGRDQANGICVSNEIESVCPADIGFMTGDKKCYALDTIVIPKIYNNAYQECPNGYLRVGVGVTFDKRNAWVCQLPAPPPAK